MCPLLPLLLLACLRLCLGRGPQAGGQPRLHIAGHGPGNERQWKVVEAFLHGWRAYKAACWGKDEIRPVSRNCTEEFGGLGVQIVDALDGLLLMGLRDEYAEAREWVVHNFTAALDQKVNIFEVTIRVLGGLLSAYFLTGDRELLRRAGDLGQRLLPAWREGPVPHELVNLATGEAGSQEPKLGSSLAEVGTLQVEFKALSAATGDPRFHWRAEHIMDLLGSLLQEAGGLLPIMMLPTTPLQWTNPRVTLGGRGDSFYEYLLKQWLLTNRTEDRFLRSYQAFTGAVRNALVGRSSPSNLTFLREVASSDALAAFLRPGANETWDAARESLAESLGPMVWVLQVPADSGPELRDASSGPALGGPEEGGEEAAAENGTRQGGCGEGSSCQADEEQKAPEQERGEAGAEERGEGRPPAPETPEARARGAEGSGAEEGEEEEEKEAAQEEEEEAIGCSAEGAEDGEPAAEEAAVQGPAWLRGAEAETCEVEGPEAEEAAPAAAPADPAAALHQAMQAMFGAGGKMRLVFAVAPAMKMEDVCATAELLLARRWDALTNRISFGVPPGTQMPTGSHVREAVSQMAGAQLAAQCKGRGRFKMDHLACFVPGLLALGVMTGAAREPAEELRLAEGLAEACVHMWLKSPLGLAPESVTWNVMPNLPDMQVFREAAHSSLRPETVESLWYLYVATGDRKYQEWGWSIFEAIEHHARVPHGGYAGVEDVEEVSAPRRRDRMETFVLSETFKYLYLLFADVQPFDLTQVVFNTEGHPVPVLNPAWTR